MRRALCGLAAALWTFALLHGRGEAAVFEIFPGAEAEDSAPYAFQPFLVRGVVHTTLYTFNGVAPDQDHSFQTYLRFDLPPNLLLPGETVTQAVVIMVYAFDFTAQGDTTGVPGALRVHRVDGPWSEATLTWVNRPVLGPVMDEVTGITQVPDNDPNQPGPDVIYLQLDITDAVREWATGVQPNYGLAFTSPTARVLGFHSLEANVPPVLRASAVIVTGPGTADADGDGYLDPVDNCPYTSNNQADSGGVGGASANGIGDPCECGDVTSPNGQVLQTTDVTAIRNALAGVTTGPQVTAAQKCNATGIENAGDGPDFGTLRDDCGLDDVVVIWRALAGRAPGIGAVCEPAAP